MFRIGFLINPTAGMGGAVGLKGTDGLYQEALRRGAEPVAPGRAERALRGVSVDAEFLTCSGDMGEAVLSGLGLNFRVVYRYTGTSTREDTVKAARRFIEEGAELVVFCGGDGTARDVYSAVDGEVPMVGIPAGVKMHSSVFGVNPEGAWKLVEGYLLEGYPLKDAEVMDIDEEAYRKGRLQVRLYGYAKTPYQRMLLQSTKAVYQVPGEDEAKEEIARYVLELMDGGTYILGAGSTLKAIGDALGIDKTLLGVDVVRNGQLVVKDASERDLLGIVDGGTKIVVTPIGSQGFVFGRGNQQISSRVIREAGKANIIIVATPNKLADTPVLRVDTGDPEVDRMLEGYVKVISGYHRMTVRKIEGYSSPSTSL